MSKLLVDEISDADNTGPVTVTDGLNVSSGNVLVGTTSNYAENVQAAFYGASNGGISLASGTSGLSRLMFADDVAGTAGAYVGSIIYSHADDSMRFNANGGTERMRILSTGGITFNGDTAAANALDDYEEGTFTLTIGGVAGAFGLGKYVKVGRLVHFQWYSSGSFTATASSANFTGLPFLTAPSSYYSVFYAYHNTYCGTASGGYLDTNGYSGVFTNNGSTSPASANATSGLYLMLAGTYYTDQ
jgi:hypothetical protein